MGYVPLTQNTVIKQTIAAANYTGSGDNEDGDGVDGLNNASTMHILIMGNSADTLAGGLKYDLILQHSDTDGSYADVTDNELIEGEFVDEDNGIFGVVDAPGEDTRFFEIEYKNNHPNGKRWSRIILDRTGNHSSGTPLAAVGIAHFPEQ